MNTSSPLLPADGSPIKGISFDLWLTLVRSNPDARRGRVAAIAKAFGVEVTDELAELSNVVSHELDVHSSQTGEDRNCADRLDAIADRLSLPRLAGKERDDAVAAVQENLLANPPRLIEPDLAESLAKLAERYRLVAISNTGYASGETMRANLAKLGVERFFEKMIFSDQAGHSKPSPKIFEAAAAALGLAPQEILHVGDSQPADIAGGRAAGFRVAWFSPGAERSGDVIGSVSSLIK